MKVTEFRVTETGGRNATTRHIPPKLALAVGMPKTLTPKGWKWSALTDLARLESGHTPSRKHPEYWGGDIPWISIGDARAHDGRTIEDTEEKTNELGIENSSARVLPTNTVCLSRTASVGYVVVMGRPMATSQDFVNWVCSKQLDHNYLKYLLIAEDDDLLRFASGSVHQTIYFPEVKAFHICHPPLAEQQRIVEFLDEAFMDLHHAKANAEKNLQNARALFESYLQSIFTYRGPGWVEKAFSELCDIKHGYAFEGEFFNNEGEYVLLTPGNFYERGGYRDRGEKQRYYTGEIPRDYVLNEGDLLVAMTEQAAGLLGSPILVPKSDKFLHNQRLGLVTQKPGVAWTNEFFFHVFNTQPVRKAIHASASGVKVRHTSPTKIGEVVVAFPTSITEQKRIVSTLATLSEETQRLAGIYERKLAALEALKKSLLHQAFTGKLTERPNSSVVSQFPIQIPNVSTTDLHAGILAIAHQIHNDKNKLTSFGHVKAEKIAHMLESYVGIDLGRMPVKDAAGPNDFKHLNGVEHRARKAGFFDFKRSDGGAYRVTTLRRFDKLLAETRGKLGDRYGDVESLINLMVPMTTQQAEIAATVFAAWNNLQLEGGTPNDNDIVYEARDNWHPAKLNIPREKFLSAIQWLRDKNMVPKGQGKKVLPKSRK